MTIVITDPVEMTSWSLSQRASGHTIAFVPTMGALHAGHMKLVERAAEESDLVVLSIFVNQLQFNDKDDFDKYPRSTESDLAACTEFNVDAVYMPKQELMYPEDCDTRVVPGNLSTSMEGASRPGHFAGVTTVVAKLFNAVQPHCAFFGEKDFQQLAIIKAMVRDLNMPLDVIGVPTVREQDGLALSSRNVRLTPANRKAASIIPNSLAAASLLFDSGERSSQRIISVTSKLLNSEPRAQIDYVTIADATTLNSIETIEREAVLAVAVNFEDVRLIDNVILRP